MYQILNTLYIMLSCSASYGTILDHPSFLVVITDYVTQTTEHRLRNTDYTTHTNEHRRQTLIMEFSAVNDEMTTPRYFCQFKTSFTARIYIFMLQLHDVFE